MGWWPVTCLLLCRDALERVDWSDEAFFFYNEDIDLSWRLQKAGCKLACATRIHVRHHEASVLLARKHHPRAVGMVRLGVRIEVAWRSAQVRRRLTSGRQPSPREQALLSVAADVMS